MKTWDWEKKSQNPKDSSDRELEPYKAGMPTTYFEIWVLLMKTETFVCFCFHLSTLYCKYNNCTLGIYFCDQWYSSSECWQSHYKLQDFKPQLQQQYVHALRWLSGLGCVEEWRVPDILATITAAIQWKTCLIFSPLGLWTTPQRQMGKWLWCYPTYQEIFIPLHNLILPANPTHCRPPRKPKYSNSTAMLCNGTLTQLPVTINYTKFHQDSITCWNTVQVIKSKRMRWAVY